MPYLNCKITCEETQESVDKVANVLLKNTSEILGKKSEVTAINIEFCSKKSWFIGEQNEKKAFYLDIKITKGTNTKEQKALYIKQVFEDMKNILGDINPASYIVIDEVESDSWGYGGRTQESRFKGI